MPDFERLTNDLRIFAAPDDLSKEWAKGYKSGKSRARFEVLMIVVALYFALALIGYFGNP